VKSLSSAEALLMLKKGEKLNSSWSADHSRRVGEAAARIAKVINLDVEKARTLGYIHDIGKQFDLGSSHVIIGYEYMKSLGYEEEYANICLTHSFLNNDINCVAAGIPSKKSDSYIFVNDFVKNHKYTIYEEIINLCDLMCTDEFMTLEERLIEIITRRGAYSNTQYHVNEALKLKEKIDNLIGKNLYSLFPEIVNRYY